MGQTSKVKYLLQRTQNELKRPSQKITSRILNQVESYAIAVAKDNRFQREKTKWRFLVVSNEIDEHAKRKANQRDKAKGLVFDDAELNIQVWAHDWTELIGRARARLQFINEKLSYEANRDTAREYLKRTHAKFIRKLKTTAMMWSKQLKHRDDDHDDHY